MDSIDAKLGRLREIFAPMKAVLIAFSGGVDSTLVLKVAHDTIGDRALALTTTSPTMPDEDCDTAIAMARSIGARHLIVDSNELEIPGYAANPVNRCYLCKTNLFTVCEAKARELGIDEIADGLNLDDLHDYRPGNEGRGRKAGAPSAGRSGAEQGGGARAFAPARASHLGSGRVAVPVLALPLWDHDYAGRPGEGRARREAPARARLQGRTGALSRRAGADRSRGG